MISKYAKKTENVIYLIFRIFLGFLFAMHGASKIGFTGKEPMTGFMLIVGILEFLVGLGILLGFLVRYAAIGGLIIMIGAWIKVHLPKGINPLTNGGELSMLFLLGFLIIFAMGPGIFSLEKMLFKKEIC